MKIISIVKTMGLSFALASSATTFSQNINKSNYINEINYDKFEREITPQGVNNVQILNTAPSPFIKIKGKENIAKFVIDTDSNILYRYNELGNVENAYLVATGKKSTPTDKGARIVTHIETYPYRRAPKVTKRYKTPRAFGPKVICLNKINTLNGKQSSTGEFIHGNNNESSLGKHASNGCIRMDNTVIKELASTVKRGDIIIIK